MLFGRDCYYLSCIMSDAIGSKGFILSRIKANARALTRAAPFLEEKANGVAGGGMSGRQRQMERFIFIGPWATITRI
jgi:hypothetical protein